jgi:asparagine synthase (glutamine-hydrolysing)
MYRFVALIWDDEDPSEARAAESMAVRFRKSAEIWTCDFEAPGIIVFSHQVTTAWQKPFILPRRYGVILGRVFQKVSADFEAGTEPTISDLDAMEMARTSGRNLTTGYWGSYVAFLHDSLEAHYSVIRDCSGHVPCYRTRYQGVHIVFSDMKDLAELQLPRFTINRTYIASFISSSQLQIRECGLNEVTELLAGDCFEIKQNAERQFSLWDPRKICELSDISDYDLAKRVMRDTAQHCIDAWASVHETIVHRLSGGLDSSIVLGCLSKSVNRPRITCFNEFSADAADDERRYARSAAAFAGVRLVESNRCMTVPLSDASVVAVQRIPKPMVSSLGRVFEIQAVNRLAEEIGAEAVWDGQGGDHIFYQMKVSLGAADFVSRRGIRPGMLRAVADAARRTQEPYASVLRDAIVLGRSRTKWVPQSFLDRKIYFLSEEIRAQNLLEYASHPWAFKAEGLPKGKQYQILLLAELLNRSRAMPSFEYRPEHHPLQSQPLIEVCLRIPSYQLQRGGRHRALARDAFSDCIPKDVAQREDKGEISHYATELVRSNETFIRGSLLEGMLVRERLVDRGELERILVNHQPMRVEHYLPLLACLACELWAQNWTGQPVKAVA